MVTSTGTFVEINKYIMLSYNPPTINLNSIEIGVSLNNTDYGTENTLSNVYRSIISPNFTYSLPLFWDIIEPPKVQFEMFKTSI